MKAISQKSWEITIIYEGSKSTTATWPGPGVTFCGSKIKDRKCDKKSVNP